MLKTFKVHYLLPNPNNLTEINLGNNFFLYKDFAWI